MQTSPIRRLDVHWVNTFLEKYTGNAPVLLAVSGGLDSMVLWDLVHKANVAYAVAHVNYHLRGKESDLDAQLVETLTKQRNVELHLLNDTSIKKGDAGLQASARAIRYRFFDSLLTEFSHVCTAHHADDQAETVLLQLGRGGGPTGLAGIYAAGDKLLRPLLPFYKKELSAYAKTNNVHFRQDRSNDTDDYLRNRVRHHLLPEADTLIDGFRQNLTRAADQQQQLLQFASAAVRQLVVDSTLTKWNHALDRAKLSATKGLSYVVHELLRKYDFQSDLIYAVYAAIGDDILHKRQFLNRNGSIRLVLTGQTMHLERTETISAFEIELNRLGEFTSPLGSMLVTKCEGNNGFGESEIWVPTLTHLTWRTTTAADTIAISDAESKTAKRVLAEAKRPPLTQQTTSSLVLADEVLWIVELRKSARLKTRKAKTAGYHLRFTSNNKKLLF